MNLKLLAAIFLMFLILFSPGTSQSNSQITTSCYIEYRNAVMEINTTRYYDTNITGEGRLKVITDDTGRVGCSMLVRGNTNQTIARTKDYLISDCQSAVKSVFGLDEIYCDFIWQAGGGL